MVMPKPTLLQTLLGRPSQTYSFPAEKHYYSAKDDLARAAAVSPATLPAAVAGIPSAVIEPAPPLPAVAYHEGSSSNGVILLPYSDRHPDEDEEEEDDDVFHTPFSSPPTSMLIDMPLSILPHDPSPPHSRDDKSSSSSSSASSSSSSHSASCSTSSTSDELHAALTALSKGPSRLKRVSPASKSYTYTDEDWAKEVRWLAQPRRASLDVTQSTITNQPKPRSRPRTVVGRPNTNRRMTALLEEDEEATDDLRASPPPSHARASSSTPLTHSNLISSDSHDSRPTSPASQTRTTVSLTSRTVELPQMPTASAPPPAPGYTALTLPRAMYRPQNPWRTLAGGRIDLPRDGRAQHSMVSIEVVRGVASANFFRAGFRSSNSGPRSLKKHDLAGALALTSHRPPPSFVPNSHVLVQVHAVGLEGLDRHIVSDRLGKGATGFVPGRGVLGRVVECGLEVSSDILKKGEWVIGLLDAKKCGALSEFVLLNRHHVHSAPQPSVPLSTVVQPQSAEAPSFSLESLALLPLLGVPAYRAVQTYTVTKSSLPPSGASGGTALVLRGQDGAGGFATLMLRAIGVNVIVQVEPSVVGLDASATATSGPFMLFSTSDDKALGTSVPRRLQEVCARLRTWGVEGICVGAPQDVLQRLDVDVDFVLDTVGGREIWDAAHTLLARSSPSRGPAQFTTIVGDAGSGKAVPTAQDHWRAGVRSLKRAMTVNRGGSQSPKGGRSSLSSSVQGATARTVGYAWVSCTADVDFHGGDVRDALAALVAMPALQHPPVDALLGLGGEYGAGRVLPFERAPEAFGGAMLEGGGTAVIRVVL